MSPAWRTRYELAIEAAHKAGDLARGFYESTFDVEKKADSTASDIDKLNGRVDDLEQRVDELESSSQTQTNTTTTP